MSLLSPKHNDDDEPSPSRALPSCYAARRKNSVKKSVLSCDNDHGGAFSTSANNSDNENKKSQDDKKSNSGKHKRERRK